MKKSFFILSVMTGMALMLTACSGNTGDTADNIANMQEEKQTDMQEEKQTDMQEEKQTDMQEESQTDMQEDNHADMQEENETEVREETGEQSEMKMNVQIRDYNFTATLENNAAVEELVEMMKEGPVTIQMDDYSGFEKVGPLGRSLTTSNSQTTTSAGDIVLYNGNNIVMFYGSNSWSYTRIGKIDDLSDWEKALGSGSITAVLTLAE